MERIVTLERRRAGYAEDVAAWADAQAALLRAGRLDEIDLPNIIEEIKSVGDSHRDAVISQIGRVIQHLLKLVYSSATDPRRGWVESILNARNEIEKRLEASPSLRREVAGWVEQESMREARTTARILKLYDELDRDAEQAMLAHRFTADEVVGDWFPPGVALKG